ncbi:MAG: hypothetical protein DRQ03_05285 [Candidatus Hydrothermota bacterium]|nr:MAG: hypothetical protein DRQ03_05285 [Candidatus Hydrothermae bacterium]
MRSLKKLIKRGVKINFADVSVITVGSLLTALGINLFLAPNKIAAGGVSGIAIILHYLIKVPIGATMLAINVILFIMAFLILGRSFGLKSIYATVILSVFVDGLAQIIPNSWAVQDLLLAVLFGDFLTGIGIAMVLSRDASTGGTDIIAMILTKFTGIDVGKTLLFVDFLVTLFAAISFGKIIGMYSLLAVIVNTTTIDYVLEGISTSFKVIVITIKGKKIAERIIKELNRGVTILEVTGAYTGEKRDMLWIILKRPREMIKLRNIIKEEDPTAFMTVSHIREVLGKGFRRI